MTTLGQPKQLGPRVTIGMPVFNGEAFVAAAIESVLGQTFGDLELVISDNASTDGTEDIARRYAALDKRVRYQRNPRNLGAAPNYNRLVSEARGEYFKWAPHDDVCAPRFVEECVRVLDADSSIVLCHPQTSIIDSNGIVLEECAENFHLMSEKASERLLGCFLAGTWVFHPIFGLLRRQRLIETPLIGGYNGADFVLLGWLALAGKCYQLPERLLFRREHENRCCKVPDDEMPKWWNTDNRGVLYFRHWRRLREYVRATTSTDLSFSEHVRCLLHVLRWARWSRGLLTEDVARAARVFWRGALRRKPAAAT